ncbi:MAG: hypothetical protein FJX99_06290 [Bacteroidetes bacterium]|nr:hypothetical protein [Bacteroidota bacterium]
MNYHFFIDEKFVDDFVNDAIQIDSDQIFIAVSSRPLRYITNPSVVHFTNYESELIPIVEKITEKDRIYVHWFTPYIMRVIDVIPSSTNIYLMFYGGDFFESWFPTGNNRILENFLYDTNTRIYHRSTYVIKTRRYLNENLGKAIASGNLKNILHTWIQNIKLKRSWLKGYLFQQEWQERKRFLNRIKAVCHWNHFDIQYLEQLYEVKLNQRYFNYNLGFENILQTRKWTKKKTCTIWLGNSDTPTNNHLDALEVLSNFKNEDVEIICPLNYGNKQYGDLVEKTGKQLFGEKFKAVRDYLDRDTYYNLMNKTNVAIMFHNRGQAGGNVIAFLKMGIKIYMKEESSIYKYYRELGVTIHNANEIKNLSFESLKKEETELEKLQNIEVINTTIGNDKGRREALVHLLTKE